MTVRTLISFHPSEMEPRFMVAQLVAAIHFPKNSNVL